MRICLQSTRFPPYNVGGEEIYVKRLYDSLSKKHEVYSINNTPEGSYDDKNIINLSVPNNRLFLNFCLPNPFIYWKLKKVIQKIRPEVIHINNPHSTFSTELFFLPKKYSKVWEIHDYTLFCLKGGDNVDEGKLCNQFNNCWRCVHQQRLKLSERKKGSFFRKMFIRFWKISNLLLRNKIFSGIRKTLVKRSIGRVNKIICPSKSVLETCKKFGINNEKLIYLPYGLDLSSFKTSEIPKEKYLGFVGRLEEIKGCHVLIKAFKEVSKLFPDSRLFIVGSGSEEKRLKSLTNRLNLENKVFFLGRKTPEELKKFYPTVQFLVFPSVWSETPALVTYEAMASERPVIASNIGDFPELIKNGKNGFLFRPSDPNDLAKKIIYLLGKPQEVKKMAKNALKTIKKYSIEEHNKKLLQVYKEAMQNT